MPGARCIHGVAHQLAEVDFGFLPARFLISRATSTQNLFHGLCQPIRVAQHPLVKLLPLWLREGAATQRFQVQPNRSDRSFQFVGYRVDETIVLLAAANLTHQEDGVHDHAGYNQREKDQTEKQQHAFAPTEDDPADIQSDRERHQADAQAEEEDDGSAAARDTHGLSGRFYRVRPHNWLRWNPNPSSPSPSSPGSS